MSKLEQIQALRAARVARNSSRGQRAPKQTSVVLVTETASDKGKAENGPSVRKRPAPAGTLASDKGTTQRADRAAPAVPRETKPKRKSKTKKLKPVKAPKIKIGRPRVEDRGKTLSDRKPWLEATPPMSRATWYRRQGG